MTSNKLCMMKSVHICKQLLIAWARVAHTMKRLSVVRVLEHCSPPAGGKQGRLPLHALQSQLKAGLPL